MKNVIWIVGALSTGKTSLNKALIESLKNGDRQLISTSEYVYTRYGNMIASLGNINDSQCCGLDRVSSKLKNEGVELSLKKALEDCNFVIVESIMSASTWFKFIKQNCDNLFLIHIHCTFEENVRRLKQRQTVKNIGKLISGVDADYLQLELTDANYEFIRKTRMQYKGIYNKFKDKCFSMEIDTTNSSTPNVKRHVLKFINKNLDAST